MQVLARFKTQAHSANISFVFKEHVGAGISKALRHCSSDAIDLIEKLLAYDPEER